MRELGAVTFCRANRDPEVARGYAMGLAAFNKPLARAWGYYVLPKESHA